MIRGKKRPLPVAAEIVDNVPKVEAKMNASIHNRFDIEVIDSRTGEVRQRAQAENVILNQMWSKMWVSEWFKYIHYGRGAGIPAAADTALFTFVAAKTATLINFDLQSKNVAVAKQKIVLAETESVGVSITEAGIGSGSASSTLMTHAMLQDMNGNPISINKTNTDIINIYATVYVHFNSDFLTRYSYYLSNASRAANPLLRRVLGLASTSVPASFIGCACISASNYYNFYVTENGAKNVNQSWDENQKTITLTAWRFSVGSQNNVGGSNYIHLGTYYSQNGYSLDPIIINSEDLGYSSIVGETIGSGNGESVDFATKFARISNVTVYLDGVMQTAVDIDENLPFILSSRLSIFKPFIMINSELCPISAYCASPYELPSVTPDSVIYQNLFNEKISVAKLTYTSSSYPITIEMSNDLKGWVKITSGAGIAPEIGCYKYVRLTRTNTSSSNLMTVSVGLSRTSDNNIHFTTPPPAGAVITADYTTATIAKDENHVFDFSMTIQLGEYVPTT